MYEAIVNEKPIYETRSIDVWAAEQNSGKKLTCNSHLHPHIEIFYLISGHVSAIVDFKRYEVGVGEALVVFPNQVHKFISHDDSEHSLLFIIHPDITPEYTELFKSSLPSDPVVRGISKDSLTERLLFSLCESTHHSDAKYHALLTKGFLISLYAELFSGMSFESINHSELDSAKSIVLFCSAHFNEDLSLEYLAKELHLSKFYISHIFNEKLDIGFNDYVNMLRYTEACRLLRESSMKIAEIAVFVGFNNVRTFNRVFTRFDSLSPSEYRRQHNYVRSERKTL